MLPGLSADVDTLVSFKYGSTWTGLNLITVTDKLTGVAPVATVVSCQMFFKAGPGASPVATLSNGNGIVIINATDWTFQVSPVKLPIKPGQWKWEFWVTDSDGLNLCWMQGDLQVLA